SMPGVARAGMHHQSRRLVDDEDRRILVYDGERNRLGGGGGVGRKLRLDAHLLPAQYLVLGAQRPALDLHRPGLDPGLEKGARILRQRAGERLIEAQSGGLRGQAQRMRAELHRRRRGRKCGIRYTRRTQAARSQSKGPLQMFLPGPVRGSVIALCIVVLAVAGCRTHREREEKKPTPDLLYKRARHDLDSNDFNAAIKIYEQLTARFPFADEARQSRLDLIYAYYRAGEGESATDAAQRAKGTIEQYDGAPAVREALQIMIESYDRLNLQPLAAQTRQVYEANYGADVRHAQAETRKAWWKIW